MELEKAKFKKEFADRLIGLIGQKNINMSTIAGLVGVSRYKVSRWCNPNYDSMPDAYELALIAEYLRTTTDYLAVRTDLQTVPRRLTQSEMRLLGRI